MYPLILRWALQLGFFYRILYYQVLRLRHTLDPSALDIFFIQILLSAVQFGNILATVWTFCMENTAPL
jgi:hypothetical protein